MVCGALVLEQEKLVLARGDVVRLCLRHEGFEVNWDGDFARKIGVSLKLAASHNA
jgi:hypothetical protein